MPVLPRFDLPARLPEPDDDRDAWSKRVGAVVSQLAGEFVQFFDPTVTDPGPDAVTRAISWTAFPALLLQQATSQEGRWAAADASRSRQDEYCEWGVERDGDGVVTRVTFTCETPEYLEHLAERDPGRLLALHHELVGPHVRLEHLVIDGVYRRDNRHNRSTEGRPVHLIQRNNNLTAALRLAAEATVLRRSADGRPVTAPQELTRCGGLGEPLRNSDPQIASAVNDAAAQGAEVCLADPMGLYLHRFLVGGMRTPDGADPASFWTVERGSPGHVLRASYAVPAERDYRVGDVEVDGRPIRFGAQLADRVSVRLTALVRPADHRPARLPCVG